MKPLSLTILVFLLAAPAFSQTYIPITNNMVVPSNSNIKFAAGNYVFNDSPANGVILLSNVHDVILDGDSCRVDGVVFNGYMIKITNSHHITIRNFDSVYRYKYAVYVTNSHHITITGNNFCRNRVDSSGVIDVWADYTGSLGGGVMMYQSRAVVIRNNVMTRQNDGVALYHCDSITLGNNDFSWNTSFGIRMFWTDTCFIQQNNCSHVNRPHTDPSDCAALLMIISNANTVMQNDLSYSGDGVFLGQYQHSDIPNNNLFLDNECSYSPHNAIEATFADGNVYRHNKCNFSHYGFWLGYSFNSVVDSNEVIGNYQTGLAIDRGFSNEITGNEIIDNPIGIELWEGSPISGYTNYHSQDYRISGNYFDGNSMAISTVNTKHDLITDNTFSYSQSASIFFNGTSTTDTITHNEFILPTTYHIQNNSYYTKIARENLFIPSDTALISAKIFDKHDNSLRGEVLWEPALPGPPAVLQIQPPCDMAEPGSVWYAYPQTGYPAAVKYADVVSFDSLEKMVGAASVKLVTSRGYDLALNYRPAGDSIARWTLSDADTLYFRVRTIRQPQYGFQYFSIRIGDDHGNYYKYTAAPSLLDDANMTWTEYRFPLSGSTQFTRSQTGTMSLAHVNYVEIHADTWDYGFTLWVDGVQFGPCSPLTGVAPVRENKTITLSAFPDPFSRKVTFGFYLEEAGRVRLELFDAGGTRVSIIADRIFQTGDHKITWSPSPESSVSPGICLVRLTTASGIVTRKIIKIE